MSTVDNIMDTNQEIFKEFEVPDPIRIDKVIRLIKKHKGRLENLSILECGVAKGGVVDRLKGKNQCFGIDINPRELEGVEIKRADLNNEFPKWDIKFDVVFAGEVIEHLLDDVKFIKNCKSVLKPDGILILTTPNLVFSLNRIIMFFGGMPLFSYAPYHYRIYNKTVLENTIREGGLNVIDLKSSHILFSTRRNKLGKIFEVLGDIFPKLGAHLIVVAKN